MNQKFIDLVEKTEKKAPVYDPPKSKRFARKRSQQSDRSVDSKRSRQTAIQSSLKINDIESIEPKNTKVHINTTDFFQQLANSVLLSKDIMPNKTRYSRGRTDRFNIESRRQSCQSKHNNFQYQNQALTAQLEVRNKELQVMVSECQLIKESLKNQQQKRKKLQQQKRQISTQLSQKIKQMQKIQIQNKKLVKEKQYLVKQIEFLEKINYDDKTRNAQSYREKYLAKQLQELRKQINMSKTDMEKHLELEVKRISDQKYRIETLYKALKVEKETLIKLIQRLKIEDRGSIFHSEEYVKLREKYKLCLDAYKTLKIEYIELQKELNRSLKNIPQHLLASNSSLSIVLSSSSSEKSNCSIGKENKGLTRMTKNNLCIEATTDKTPTKKSLSPRNRQDKQQLDFKKPISPVSHKKSYENSNATPEVKISSKQGNQKTEKKTTFFNDEYRLKIGLGKTHEQK